MDIILPNFVYALILTISKFGLLQIIVRKFVAKLWPLIDVRVLFQLTILRTNGNHFTKFYICIYNDRI